MGIDFSIRRYVPAPEDFLLTCGLSEDIANQLVEEARDLDISSILDGALMMMTMMMTMIQSSYWVSLLENNELDNLFENYQIRDTKSSSALKTDFTIPVI
jgi:hypothetical protein